MRTYYIYYLLLGVHEIANCKIFSELAEDVSDDNLRKNILQHLVEDSIKKYTELLKGYRLLSRRIVTNIKQFENYKDTSVIYFQMLRDVSEARFTFLSDDLLLSNIGSCVPQYVIINIKRGSYPAVNPDEYEFPKHFISPSRRNQIHTIEIMSNRKEKLYFIKNPEPGYWYAIIYIKWEDPMKKKVKQKGIGPDCKTFLNIDLQVKQEQHIESFDCHAGMTVNYNNVPATFKCMAFDSIKPINCNITITNSYTNSEAIVLRIQALTFPTEEKHIMACAFDPTLNHVQTVTFSPYPNEWHYIHLDRTKNISKYTACESLRYYRAELEEIEGNNTVLELKRDDKGWFATFDFGIPKTNILDSSSIINVTSNDITTVRFQINQFVDIGGNLVIKINQLMGLDYYMGYRKHKKLSFKTVICLDIGYASVPLKRGVCKFNNKIKPALFVLNNNDNFLKDSCIIPFPDNGMWYLTIKMFCDDSNCPFDTFYNGTNYLVRSENTRRKDGSLKNIPFIKNRNNILNGAVMLSVSSQMCKEERCEGHGKCYVKFSDMSMSYCRCDKGYGGWDCSDDSRMKSKFYLILAVLLLTLSNLFFLITIYVAVIRIYYTEALMYSFTMVFSTFYHACYAPDLVAFCISSQKHILKFGDFFCGIICFWVTLLAMSILSDKLRMPLLLLGMVIIALLTQNDMHSIVTFLTPVVAGVVILLLSWFWDHSKMQGFRYPRLYYKLFLPIGLVLVSIGLICYAFWETERNYEAVHSIWHGLIALSVAFLLPDAKRDEKQNPFLPSPHFCRFWHNFCMLQIFDKSQHPQPNVIK